MEKECRAFLGQAGSAQRPKDEGEGDDQRDDDDEDEGERERFRPPPGLADKRCPLLLTLARQSPKTMPDISHPANLRLPMRGHRRCRWLYPSQSAPLKQVRPVPASEPRSASTDVLLPIYPR